MDVKQNVMKTIIDTYQQIHLDNTMYVNKVSYMIAICKHIKMINCIIMDGQDEYQVSDTVEMIIKRYSQSGFRERIKCVRFNMPFTKMSRDFLIEVVLQTVTLMNFLPRKDGIHSTLSSREIVTGKKFCVPRHKIGGYIRVHMSHKMDNDTTKEQTVDDLYLGPSDNDDGHNVFTLSTKQKISVNKVSMIPITSDVVDRVNNMGKDVGQPDGLEFTSPLSNINTHSDGVSINRRITTKDALSASNTFYNVRKDPEYRKLRSEFEPGGSGF